MTRALSTIAVPTRGRVPTLMRCLRSYAANAARWGRPLRFVVFDDHPRPAVCGLVGSGAFASLGADVRCLARGDLEPFVQAVTGATGAQADLVRFACGEPHEGVLRPGGRRNALRLLAAQPHLVCVDDDTVCRLWCRTDADESMSVTVRPIAMDVDYFAVRADAFAVTRSADHDFYHQHQRWLGEQTAAPDGTTGRVCLTQSGLLGDVATDSPEDRVEVAPDRVEEWASTPQHYELVRVSREVVRAPSNLRIARPGGCQTYALGIDECSGVPPFFPTGRGEDTILAMLMGFSAVDTWCAYLMQGVVHDPPTARTFSADAIVRGAGDTSLASVVVAAVLAGLGPSARLSGCPIETMGRNLEWVGSRSWRIFESAVLAELEGMAAARIAILTRLAGRVRRAPDRWRADVSGQLVLLQAKLRSNALGPVRDWPTLDLSTASGRRQLQHAIAQYGRLLQLWPEWVRRLQGSGALEAGGGRARAHAPATLA